MSVSDTRRLAELIGRKHDCLVQLRDLGIRQLELVGRNDMPQLLKVLSAKGHLIGLMQAIEHDLEPFRNDDPAARQWQSDGERQQVAEMLGICEQLLAQIIAQEKQSEDKMVLRRDEAAGRLQGVHVAAAARSAYQKKPSNARGLLDLSSDA